MKVARNATNKKKKRSWWKFKLAQHIIITKIVACDAMFCEEKMLLTMCNTMLWKEDVNDNEQNNATTKHPKKVCRWQNAMRASETSKKFESSKFQVSKKQKDWKQTSTKYKRIMQRR
jgi:hypothetical protein